MKVANWVSVASLATIIAASPAARADDDTEPFHIGSSPAWILLGGVTSGGTIALADRGAFVGGELSLARLNEGKHVGLYTDAYYDWGANGAYVTGGIELGWKVLGIDGGAALRFADGDRQLGATGRLTIGAGIFALFGRYAYFTDTMVDEHVIQIGLLVKLPFVTFGGY